MYYRIRRIDWLYIANLGSHPHDKKETPTLLTLGLTHHCSTPYPLVCGVLLMKILHVANAYNSSFAVLKPLAMIVMSHHEIPSLV